MLKQSVYILVPRTLNPRLDLLLDVVEPAGRYMLRSIQEVCIWIDGLFLVAVEGRGAAAVEVTRLFLAEYGLTGKNLTSIVDACVAGRCGRGVMGLVRFMALVLEVGLVFLASSSYLGETAQSPLALVGREDGVECLEDVLTFTRIAGQGFDLDGSMFLGSLDIRSCFNLSTSTERSSGA